MTFTWRLKDSLLIFLDKYFVMSVPTLILVLLLLNLEVKMEKSPHLLFAKVSVDLHLPTRHLK